MRQRWLLDYAKTGRVPDLTVPNMAARGEAAPTLFGACAPRCRPGVTCDGCRSSGAGRS